MTTETSLPLKAHDPCPLCGHLVAHSGALHQPDPNGAPLPEPVELLRCWHCHRTWRADREPYDEQAVSAAWRAYEAERAGEAKPK